MQHEVMLMMRLWMAPPLFIVSAKGLHVTYHTCGGRDALSGTPPPPLPLPPGTKKGKRMGKAGREGGREV